MKIYHGKCHGIPLCFETGKPWLNSTISHGNYGVLKQLTHGKISWCFETGKPWYTIHLPYTIYEKHGIPQFTM